MRPSVRSDLVSIGVLALNNGRPRETGVVDFALSVVVTSNEESRLSIVLGEEIKQVRSVPAGTVIVGDRDSSRLATRVDTCATIGDTTEYGS